MNEQANVDAPRGCEGPGVRVLFRPAARDPSGEQFLLRLDDQEAVVTEVGATLRAYTVAGQALLDGFAADALPVGARGQVLAPWPNRIAGGRYGFQGQPYQLALDEPELGNAIHGLVRWQRWAPLERGAAQVTLSLLLPPQPGYPFTLALAVAYALEPDGLAVRTTAHNLGASPLPFGLGQHPYFSLGTAQVDAAHLQLPAGTRVTTDARAIPTGRVPVAGTEYDFRSARPIGTLHLDTCFTDLQPDSDGWTRVALSHPTGRPRLTLALDGAYRYVQLYTGDTLPNIALRRRSVAIEPMTCPANAFNSGEGLLVLPPGGTFAATWRAQVR